MFIDRSLENCSKEGDYITMRRNASTGEAMGSRLIYTPRAKKRMKLRAKKEEEYAKSQCGPCHAYLLNEEQLHEELNRLGISE